MDCYGYLIEWEKRAGREMVDYYYDYSDISCFTVLDENMFNIIHTNKLVKTDNASYGDVLVFYSSKGRVCHIGVKLNGDDFTHCDINGVTVGKLSKFGKKWSAYTWQK